MVAMEEWRGGFFDSHQISDWIPAIGLSGVITMANVLPYSDGIPLIEKAGL